MREHLALALLAIPDVIAGKLNNAKGVVLLLVGVFLAGAGAMATMGEFAGHEARIQGLETWVVAHENDVVEPTLRRLESLSESVSRQRRMEILISCIYYDIRPCPNPAPDPPPSGGER